MDKFGIFIYILISFFTIELSAQDIKDFFGQKTLDRYVIKHYNNENGLKQTIVEGLLLDQNEFLWLNTPSGLVRWDNNKFKYFRNVAGNDGRVSKFQKSPQNENEYIVSFQDFHFGYISESNFHESSKRINHEIFMNSNNPSYTKKLMPSPSLEIDFLNIYFKSIHEQIYINDSLYFFKDGFLEFAMKNDLLRFHESTSNASVFTYNNSFFAILIDYTIVEYKSADSIIYHNTLKELIGEDERVELNNKNNELRLLGNIDHKNPAIIYKNDLYDIRIVNDSLIFKKSSLDLNISAISDIVYTSDKENIFISSQSEGLFHLRRKRITSSFEPNSNRVQTYRAHIETDDGRIMTGLKTIIDDGVLKDQECFNEAMSMLKTKNGLIYNMDLIDIKVFDPKTNECDLITFHDERSLIRMLLDEKGIVWIVRRLKSMEKNHDVYDIGFLDENNSFNAIDVTFHCTTIESINMTPRGKIQVNSKMHIYFIDRITGHKDSIATPKELEIRDVWYLNDTLAILATYNRGLYSLQNNKIVALDIKSDKIKNASCIIEDEFGILWVTSNEGLFKIEKSHLLSYIKDKTSYLYYNHYDTSFGLSNNEFNGNCDPCGYQLSDGRISFPSQKGLNFIDSKEISQNQNAVKKVISTMVVDDKEIIKRENISINPDFYELKFELAIPNHLKNETIHIFHKLVGYEEEWNQFDPNKTILYSRLAPGDYSFQYKITRDGENTDILINEIKFEVEKKWYQWNLSILFFILSTLLLLYFLFQFRLKFLKNERKKLQKAIAIKTEQLNKSIINLNANIEILEETKEELLSINLTKNKLLSIISHEIVGGLKMIQNISKILVSNNGKFETEDIIDSINSIYSASSETNSILNQILIWTKNQNKDMKPIKEKFNLYGVADRVIKQIATQSKDKNIHVKILIDKAHSIYSDKNIILLILHTLLENEIKHNSDCTVSISSINREEEHLITIYNDNDEGGLNINIANNILNNKFETNLDSSYLVKGLGFWIVRDLLNKLEGSILFHRDSHQSHTIEISIPQKIDDFA